MLFAGMAIKQPFAGHFFFLPPLRLGEAQEYTDYVAPSPTCAPETAARWPIPTPKNAGVIEPLSSHLRYEMAVRLLIINVSPR